MSSALHGTVPTPPQGPPHLTDTAFPAADGHDQDRLLADDWVRHINHMNPADLRLLAASLPLIEQAKGILMGHFGCDAVTAFTILRRWSSSRKLKLRDLATALVDEASGAGGGGGQRSRAVERFLQAHGLGQP